MKKQKENSRTRRRILDHIKREGPQDSTALAEEMEVTAMAIRQHLYALEEEGLVTFEEEPRPRGRPAKLWGLTAAADKFFPSTSAELVVDILTLVRKLGGHKLLEDVIRARADEKEEKYRDSIDSDASLSGRLATLAQLRTDEGYMAEVLDDGETAGSYLLVENHCPICEAATNCQQFCSDELRLFREALGETVAVDRVEHILEGGRRCAYRVSETDAG